MPRHEPQSLANIPPTSWKNGGGQTRTLAVHPPNATIDNFDWRISLADVTTAGPFSLFPNVDRTILLWSGPGLTLKAPTFTHTLNQPLHPFPFPGEAPVTSTLINGPTTDLNIMVRRNLFRATIHLHDQPRELPSSPGALILLCHAGAITVNYQIIPANHFLRLDTHPALTLTPASPNTTFLLITLHKI